jgi:Tol biopolymer transport system component
LLAYSSDRGGGGDQDIWLQQVSGGLPVRLTDNPGDDVEPSFSPDGTVIVYRAEGQAEGVYLVPTLGGKSVLLARGGYRPRFAPDGAHIAFWTGERMFRAAKIFIVPSAGGTPVQFQPDFQYAAFPIWSPDGRFLAFVGSKGHSVREESNTDDWDWWVAPVAGGPAVHTWASKVFERQHLRAPESSRSHRRIVPDCWTASGNLVFSARSGDETNVWQLPIAEGDWKTKGPAEQVTFGAGREDHPSVSADGSLAFSVLTHKSDIWGLPMHVGTAEPSGPMVRLTSGQGSYSRPVASRNGARLAFLTNRSGNREVWVKDLKTGRESELTATLEPKDSPILSPDGTRVAFEYPPPHRESIFVVPFGGGEISQICDECGEPRAWLPDGSGLLYQKLSAKGDSIIGLLHSSGTTTTLLQSSESALFSPSASPDGKWLALLVRTPPNDHRVTLVPLRNGAAVPKQEWIFVTESGPWVNKPRWSPDGNLLYYVSDRDGFACIWAQRLDPVTKKPAGEPEAVVHFHSSHDSLDTVYGMELSVAEDKLVFNLGEGSGNIWLMPAAGR